MVNLQDRGVKLQTGNVACADNVRVIGALEDGTSSIGRRPFWSMAIYPFTDKAAEQSDANDKA